MKKIQELGFNKNEYAIGLTYDKDYGIFVGIRNKDDENKSRIRHYFNISDFTKYNEYMTGVLEHPAGLGLYNDTL